MSTHLIAKKIVVRSRNTTQHFRKIVWLYNMLSTVYATKIKVILPDESVILYVCPTYDDRDIKQHFTEGDNFVTIQLESLLREEVLVKIIETCERILSGVGRNRSVPLFYWFSCMTTQ